MNQLQKFDATLAEFDQEIAKLKPVSEVYQAVKNLAEQYDIMLAEIKTANQKLNTSLSEYKNFEKTCFDKLTTLQKSVSDAQKALDIMMAQQLLNLKTQQGEDKKAILRDLEIKINEIRNKNEQFQNSILEQQKELSATIVQQFLQLKTQQSEDKKAITASLETKINEIKKQNEDFKNNLIDIVERLHRENKQFYKDIEDTIRIKLQENKSEIERLVEAETKKLKEVFTEALIKQTNEIQKQQKSQITNTYIGFAIMILGLCFVMYKLMI